MHRRLTGVVALEESTCISIVYICPTERERPFRAGPQLEMSVSFASAGLSRSATNMTSEVVKRRHRTIVFAETPESPYAQRAFDGNKHFG